MGGAADPRASFEQVNLDPAIASQLRQVLSGFSGATGQYGQAAQQAAQGVNTNFGQYAPSINSQFGSYNPNLNTNFTATTDLDPRAQALLSSARADQAAGLAGQNRQLAQQFSSQPGVLSILQQQARAQQAQSANPLLFQAAQEQYGRQVTGEQLQNQALLQQAQQGAAAQQMGNQANLQRTEANASLAGAGNAALGQQLGYGAQALSGQQNLLAALSSLGQLYGSRFAGPLTPSATNQVGNAYVGQNFPNLNLQYPSGFGGQPQTYGQMFGGGQFAGPSPAGFAPTGVIGART